MMIKIATRCTDLSICTHNVYTGFLCAEWLKLFWIICSVVYFQQVNVSAHQCQGQQGELEFDTLPEPD